MLFNRIQKRYASVLTTLPPSPNYTSTTNVHINQPHIITPVTEPLTANSNNAFNPNYIPKNTKERLTLEELYQVLDHSKSMYQLLQNKYILQQQGYNNRIIDNDDLKESLDKLLMEIKKIKTTNKK